MTPLAVAHDLTLPFLPPRPVFSEFLLALMSEPGSGWHVERVRP